MQYGDLVTKWLQTFQNFDSILFHVIHSGSSDCAG